MQTLNKHQIPMISNEKMEQLWWKYKNEGVAKNLSMQSFCSMYNVPYNAFEKYLKLRRHFSDVHQVTVTDIPNPKPSVRKKAEKQPEADPAASVQETKGEKPITSEATAPSEGTTRMMISIHMSNGTKLFRRDLDYRGLRTLVEKLEVLC